MGSRFKRMLVPLMLLPVLLGYQGPAPGAGQHDAELAKHIQALLLSSQARQRLHLQLQTLSAEGGLSPGEQADFEAFLADLDARINAQCQAIRRQHSNMFLQQLPCATTGGGFGFPSGFYEVVPMAKPHDEQTPEESVALLDAQLGKDLGEFDELLLREQNQLKEQRRAARGMDRNATSTGVGRYGGGEGSGEESGDSTDSGDQHEGSNAAQNRTEGREAESDRSQTWENRPSSADGRPQRSASSAPADIPEGSDDDIVARQIREAAEKEQDPELKARLWDEYRRYKKGKS